MQRWSVGATRARLRGSRTARHIETRLGVNFEHEKRQTPWIHPIENDTLSTTYSWVRRDVDQIPIRAAATFSSWKHGGDERRRFGQGFWARLWPASRSTFPSAARCLILRGELGAVEADTADIVPTRFLFRTGGSTTVRGYDFESLGVASGGATVGGRALAVASAEYVHWLQSGSGNWGIAAFVDVGDAADSFSKLEAAIGVGIGVRWRTVAGPLAVDVAYGEREKQFRLHFSVAIAF